MAELNNNGKETNNDKRDKQKASGLVTSVPVPSTGAVKPERKKLGAVRNTTSNKLASNIVFFIALTLFAACVVFLIVWFSNNSLSENRTEPIHYTVMVQNSDESIITKNGKCVIDNGSNVYINSDKGSVNIGKVCDSRVTTNGDGTAKVLVLIEAEAIHKVSKGYFVNGEKIAVGREYDCRFSGYTDKCTVISFGADN